MGWVGTLSFRCVEVYVVRLCSLPRSIAVGHFSCELSQFFSVVSLPPTFALRFPSFPLNRDRMKEQSGRAVMLVDISSWVDCHLPRRLSELTATQLAVCKQWDEAMRRSGVLSITGHGIPLSVFDDLRQEMNTFFTLTAEQKLQFQHGLYGNSEGGFTPVGNENVALSVEGEQESPAATPFDPVESFVFTQSSRYLLADADDLPAAVQALARMGQSYVEDHMERVLKILHYISAGALNMNDLSYFDRYYGPAIDSDDHNGNCLRLAFYPASQSHSATKQPAEDEVRYGAHTDYQGYTILKPDPRDWHRCELVNRDNATMRTIASFGGLEVLDAADNQWHRVKLPSHSDELVINAGDFLQRWTNDRWRSPMHRVVGQTTVTTVNEVEVGADDEPDSPCEDPELSRKAIVFFSGPLKNVLIETVVAHPSDTVTYAPIRAGEHLAMKLSKTNLL